MRRALILLLTLLVAGTAGAQKIYLNPSDQIHNVSPDESYNEAAAMKIVAQKLQAKLSARGFEVQNSDGATMRDSCDAANAWPADIFISLHSNAAGSKNSGKAHGTNTLYYFPRDGREPNPISIKLALLCDERVVEKMTTYGRGHNFAVTPDFPFLPYNLYVLRRTNMPGTLVEGLFHDNEEDTAVLKTDEGKDAYAQGVYEAICDYFGQSYYPDAPILDPVGPVANDSEGNLALVVRREKLNAEVIRQTGVNGQWSDEWVDLGGRFGSDPVIARNAQGRLQVFAQDYGGHLWHKVQASAGSDRWNGWYDLGGDIRESPAVARNADGRLVVFAIGRDGRLRCRMQAKTTSALVWGEWQDIGGPVTGSLSVCPDADGHIVVAWRATEKGMMVAVQSGDEWTVSKDMEDVCFGYPVLARGPGDRVASFCAGSFGHLFARAGTAFEDLGGEFVCHPGVGISTDGRFEVFMTDYPGVVWHNSQDADGKWTGWQSLGGEFICGPRVGRNRDGRIEVFAVAKDGKVMYRVQREPGKSAIWDGWYTVGENFTATVREYPPAPAQ